MEDSGRESQVKSSMLCKSLGWLSVIIRLTIASIDGEDFTVASVGSHCNVAPTEVIRCKVIQNIKISARPLNGTENLRVFTLLLSERLVHYATAWHQFLYC